MIIAADGEVEYTFTVPTNGKYCIYTDVAGVYVDAYTSSYHINDSVIFTPKVYKLNEEDSIINPASEGITFKWYKCKYTYDGADNKQLVGTDSSVQIRWYREGANYESYPSDVGMKLNKTIIASDIYSFENNYIVYGCDVYRNGEYIGETRCVIFRNVAAISPGNQTKNAGNNTNVTVDNGNTAVVSGTTTSTVKVEKQK